MSDPFVSEIRIFAFNYAPPGWAFCDGENLPRSQHPRLFSLIGTTYGTAPDGYFALPDLRGRAPMHPGQGPGLSPHTLGEADGVETVTLEADELPVHRHTLQGSTATATASAPDTTLVLGATTGGSAYRATGTTVAMGDVLASTGGGQPHNNMQPYLAMNFCIALVGVTPVPE
ncbi:MAG: phage tail protein [Chloroflexi bacterium]|nr:MAG: phage tail protein [Chloroflexota bacterium]